jgi:uncharacterized protein YajQ (UPF0234 family)
MPSFDIISDVDMHELRNAIDQTNREIATRFDFKGTGAVVEQEDTLLTLRAEAEFQLKQMMSILVQKLAKRGVDVGCLDEGEIEVSGKKARQRITVRRGIDSLLAKKMLKMIKDTKLKVQASIQGEKVRVSGKKRDELQRIISLLREAKLGLPLQFENFRD